MTKSEEWARDIRGEIVEASHDVGRQGVHLGSALSATDILAVLYADVLKYDVTHPMSEERDFFILSKGHAYIGYYATLAKAGFFTNEDIKEQFMTDNGWLPVHPVKKLDKGIEFSGGSLGTGMPYSVGKAYAMKITFEEELSPMHPASVIRLHPDCRTFCDVPAAAQLSKFTRDLCTLK